MVQATWTAEHVIRYRETDGVDGHIWNGFDGKGTFPCLLLTTLGRKSNTLRTTPLIYGNDGRSYIVIASQGGLPTHPHWYENLTLAPEVEIQVKAEKYRAQAGTIGGERRNVLWEMMVEIYPPYRVYQEKATPAREIPVVELVPIGKK